MQASSGTHHTLYCPDLVEQLKVQVAIHTREQFACKFEADDYISNP